MNSNYRRNLSFGFGFSLLTLLVSTVASYISINGLLKSSSQVAGTHSFIKELDNVITTLVDAETGQRGFLLTGENVFLDPYRGATQRATTALDKIRIYVAETPVLLPEYYKLETLVNDRMSILRDLIEKKRAGKPIILDDLKKGKDQMDDVRQLVNLMETSAQNSLLNRTDRLGSFATYTRIMIVLASLLALVITIIFYVRLNKDFEERMKLQSELIDKDRSISDRIRMIHSIANKISLGNYKIRINSEDVDTLGSLAESLNKMAQSLEHSFELLSDKDWLQTGSVELNEKMMGGADLGKLCENVINYMAEYTNSQVGVIYLLENESELKFCSSYCLPPGQVKKVLALGEGLSGQSALDGKVHMIEDIDENSIVINHASGSIKPKTIIAFPLNNEGVIKGVIELAKVNPYTKRELAFIELAYPRIAGVINRMQNRIKMQELLEETQTQAEELHTHHAELQKLNAEMEAYTQKLQFSEEELRVQQEELMNANDKLKERTYALEEKNQMIQERNVEIQRRVEELALITKYKSEFLANMSHELRTPLNSILLLSSLMISNNEKKLNEEHVEYARVIQSSGNGLLSLIDEILDLSKIESGKMELQYDDISVRDILDGIASLFKPFAVQKQIDFVTTLKPDVPLTIQTDRMRLEQVLKNLLSNAFKFTPADGKIELIVSMAPKDPYFIAFSVKDSGIGIAADKQSLIFEAFQQEDGSTRRKYGGTGLGLSISRELIKLLSGKIDLHSEVGMGSEFTAYVPTVAPDLSEGGIPLSHFDTGIHNPENTANVAFDTDSEQQTYVNLEHAIDDDRDKINFGGKSILIIEDDAALARILLDFARNNGYQGLVATRGDDGLEMARKFKPSGILLDINLPVKNGWEIMNELKNDTGTKDIPVHVMSSNKLQKESLLKGADNFLDKPLAFDKIKSIFNSMDKSESTAEKKVIIVEEDAKHATALAYYLTVSSIHTKIKHDLADGIESLLKDGIDCVILDNITTEGDALKRLDEVTKASGLETLPIVILTSKNISKEKETYLKRYSDSIVLKTAFSYKRILDEVTLFLHVVEEEKKSFIAGEQCKKLGALNDVLKDKTILVADDDVRNIFSLTKALELYKVKVITAMDGKEALIKLGANVGVDLVLMDMMMPEMDGYDATRLIKNDPKLKNIPVIAVTAKAMTGDREKCVEAGASDYITKPVDVDQLLSLLRVWLYEGQFTKIEKLSAEASK